MSKIFVGFDAEKIKHPNTGLNSFCHHLAAALRDEALRDSDAAFKVFLPRVVRGYYGHSMPEHVYRFYDKQMLFVPGMQVWHQPFQSGQYFPKGNLRTLLTVHDLNYLYESRGGFGERERRVIQRNIDRCDRIVAISEFTKKDVCTHLDTHGKPVDVVYNGCCRYEGDIVPPRELPDRPFLFNIGTILTKKNIHVLPALLRGNDYMLCIAGNRSGYERVIWAYARLYGVADRVRIVGPVSEAEKHWYLKHCEAFLFPSIAEGFGLPVIEAMQYGKPCFLSRHTCLPEIGGEYAYYFDYDFHPDAMLEEFTAGMTDFALRDRRADIIHHAASFSWQKAAREYWRIYREMI